MNDTTLLKFPCEFSIKVFGIANDEFETAVLSIIRHEYPDMREDAIQHRHSKDKKYIALTITFTAKSKEQIDNIYKELSANPHVLMAL